MLKRNLQSLHSFGDNHNQREDKVIEFILLAEFNEIEGKMILGHYPASLEYNNMISTVFDRYSDFLIPRDELCAQFMSIELIEGYYLISLPVVLKNKEKDQTYKRAKYFFGVTMAVRKARFEADRLNYEQMIRKITYFFVILEQEQHALYNLKQREIKAILRNTYTELNNSKQTTMNYKGKYFTFVSTCTIRNIEKRAKPYEIPLTTFTSQEVQSINHHHLKRILREVAFGESCAKKISDELDENLEDVLEYLNIGIRYGVIYMMDLFGLENVYVLTKEIHKFGRDKERLQKVTGNIINANEMPDLTYCEEVLEMYLRLKRSKNVRFMLEKYSEFFSVVSIVRFIRIGIIEGIIKRVREILTPNRPLHENIDFVTREIYERDFQYIKWREEAIYPTLINASIKTINERLNEFVKRNAEVDEVLASLCIPREALRKIVEPHEVVLLLAD